MKRNIKDILSAVFLLTAFILICLSYAGWHSMGNADFAAKRTGKILSSRMSALESMVENGTRNIPEDMVVYRYHYDSLYSWSNQFSVVSDDISGSVVFSRLTDGMMSRRSPLCDVDDSLRLFNFGPRWYVAKAEKDGVHTSIYGIEILNDRLKIKNRFLKIPSNLTPRPLNETGGVDVCVDGRPVFKLSAENLDAGHDMDAALLWISYILVLLSVLFYMASSGTVRRLLTAFPVFFLATLGMYFWGLSSNNGLPVFSPTLYAGNSILPSLGSCILLNLLVLVMSLCLYEAKTDILSRIHTRRKKYLLCILALCISAVIMVYGHYTLKNILVNSGISLELYKLSSLSLWTGAVYVSYLGLALSIPLLLQFAAPAVGDSLSVRWRIGWAVAISVFVVILSAVLGFRKEEARLEVWAGRLAVDRDIVLELDLKRIENQISSDLLISALASLDNTAPTIQRRIVESYMGPKSQNYDVSVYLFNGDTFNAESRAFFEERIRTGIPISEDSRFLYSNRPGSAPRYDGVFIFIGPDHSVNKMIVEVERTESPNVPSFYSYARYKDDRIIAMDGTYAYQTVLSPRMHKQIFEERQTHLVMNEWSHFVTLISDDEAVIISRARISPLAYVVAFLFVLLFSLGLISLFVMRRRDLADQRYKNYYKTRIFWVFRFSMLLSMVAMAAVSVLFVYKRNEAALTTLISDKVSSIQNSIRQELKSAGSVSEVAPSELVSIIGKASKNYGTDVTLYAPDGRLLFSTSRPHSELLFKGSRIDMDVFRAIVGENRRYFIRRETIARHRIYSMYAPVLNEDGKLLAVICSPYTGDEPGSFERDALAHSFLILIVFLMLIILSRYVLAAILDRIFNPLLAMGEKMGATGLGQLEQIRYDRNDEITPLVNAYNRMVVELSESGKRLAQAERDKAWSGMARQVAHEIKNPLTPMKLQLQRIIRLKQKGDSGWQDKFDEMTGVILDHIDILTETANEFSDFAKLYTEEPVKLDLDRILREEIAMFDSRSGIVFEYRGLSGAEVMGPGPQLTRVFVNLINNAVQAVGDEGRILVSLRNSVRDGYYDIVFEDDGPGVSEENRSRLFTPNFTTKSGGSGLGLAISRSVLEKCEASIEYSKSFALGGACFTVRYPKLTNIS